MMRTLLGYILIIITMNGFAQHETHVVGLNVIVTAAENKKTLKNVRISIVGDSLNTIKTNKKGEFELTILKNTEVVITFMVKGYVSKTILVNTFTASNIKNTKQFELELVLSAKQERLNYALLDFPIVKIHYCKQSEKIKYNRAYNIKMKTKYRKFIQKIENSQLVMKD